MATFTMRHELECDPDRFWKLFFDTAFSELQYKALEFPMWKLLAMEESDTTIVRRTTVRPKVDAPAAVVKLLGTSFGFDEDAHFDKATKTMKLLIKPNVMTDKLRSEGTVRCEPRGDGKSLRIVDMIVEAKVFGVGGMIEGAFEKSLRTGWQKGADFLNQWVKDHP